MSDLFPVFLSLRDQPVLVVGGGAIAAQKLQALAPTGARVTLVAPEVSTEALAAGGEAMQVRRRPYEPADVQGARVVFAATADAALNARVVADARAAGALANAVDQPAHCDFYTAATARQGDVVLAVSSSGRLPGLARVLRETLEALLPAEHLPLLARLEALRNNLRTRIEAPEVRAASLKHLVQALRETYLPEGSDDERGNAASGDSATERAAPALGRGDGQAQQP